MTQELIRKYKRKSAQGNCLLKIDIRKAYDHVKWGFVKEMMEDYGFPETFSAWVIECITTTAYIVSLNGENCDTF